MEAVVFMLLLVAPIYAAIGYFIFFKPTPQQTMFNLVGNVAKWGSIFAAGTAFGATIMDNDASDDLPQRLQSMISEFVTGPMMTTGSSRKSPMRNGSTSHSKRQRESISPLMTMGTTTSSGTVSEDDVQSFQPLVSSEKAM